MRPAQSASRCAWDAATRLRLALSLLHAIQLLARARQSITDEFEREVRTPFPELSGLQHVLDHLASIPLGNVPPAALTSATLVWPAGGNGSEAEVVDRLVAAGASRRPNGLLIEAGRAGEAAAALTAAGLGPVTTRNDQADVVLAAAAITGLAVLARAGRLRALGFEESVLLERLDKRFAPPTA